MTSDATGAGAFGDAVARDIRRLWDGHLVAVARDVAERHDLSQATAALLSVVGLPSNDPLEIEFFHDERLLSSVLVDDVTYLGVAEDTGALLALRAGTDELWSVDPDGVLPTRFVNSSLAAFLLFLGLLGSRMDDLSDEDAVSAAVDVLRREFAERDARALDHVNSWWRPVLEQALEGYL